MEKKPKTIAFICVGNACRSQMAEGFARHHGKGRLQAFSAGSHPAGFVAPMAIQVMKEKGIDISMQKSKAIEELPLTEFDYVITMGCEVACPNLKGKKRMDWSLPDPIGQATEVFRIVRDQIEEEIKTLLAQYN